jgi:hypothetical protein
MYRYDYFELKIDVKSIRIKKYFKLYIKYKVEIKENEINNSNTML